MGEAKRRGTYEQRLTASLIKQEAEAIERNRLAEEYKQQRREWEQANPQQAVALRKQEKFTRNKQMQLAIALSLAALAVPSTR